MAKYGKVGQLFFDLLIWYAKVRQDNLPRITRPVSLIAETIKKRNNSNDMNRQELIMNYAGDLISLTALALIVGFLVGCFAAYIYYRQKEHIREKFDYEKQIKADLAKLLRIHDLMRNIGD